MVYRFIKDLCASREGSTITEYALIASLIAVALGSTILALGEGVEAHYEEVETRYSDVND